MVEILLYHTPTDTSVILCKLGRINAQAKLGYKLGGPICGDSIVQKIFNLRITKTKQVIGWMQPDPCSLNVQAILVTGRDPRSGLSG